MNSINYNNFPQLSSELFSIFNSDGFAVDASPGLQQTLGYSLQELKRTPFTEFIHQDDLERSLKAIEKLPHTKKLEGFENRYLSKNGSMVYFIWDVVYDDKTGLMYGYAKDITESKEKEYFLTKTSQLAKIGGWKFNIFQRSIEWTDETYKIHELDEIEEITIKKALSYFTEHHRKIIANIYKNCYRGRSFSVNLKINITKNNIQKWVCINGEPQFINGKLRYIQGTYQDINDEMLNKIKLIESEERYRFALEASNDFIWDWDMKSDQVYYSEQLATSLGYQKTKFDKDYFLSLVHPDDEKNLLNQVENYFKKRDRFESEFRIKNASGKYLWFRTKGKALFDQSDEPFRMSGSFADITNIKSKESELQRALRSASTYQFALNKVSIVVTVNNGGYIEYVNEQFTKTTGYTNDDVVGKGIYFLFGTAYKQEVVDHIWNSLQKGITWEGTLKNKTKDGEDFWVDMYAVPLSKTVDNISYMFIAHDKTNEIQIMGELEEERIKTLQSSKLAALGEMAGGIAHEINNPLAIIHGYASNMKTMIENNDIETSKGFVDKIVSTTERIATIVKSLKSFSRSSENDSFQKINFIDIMNDTLTFCYEKLKINNINLNINTPDNECVVLCRQVEIAQVFLNLVNNACDALEKSPIKNLVIKVSFADDKNLKISVIDTGPGIDSSIKDKILNPFFTTKEVGKGTGLGLSISKKIIDSHNGVLDFKCESGLTEFYFTLPTVGSRSCDERRNG